MVQWRVTGRARLTQIGDLVNRLDDAGIEPKDDAADIHAVLEQLKQLLPVR